MAQRIMKPLEITKDIVHTARVDDGDDDVNILVSTAMMSEHHHDGDGTMSMSTTLQPTNEVTTRRQSNDNDGNINNMKMPDSPRSFDSNELFDDVLDEPNDDRNGMRRITDDDLERLMGNDNLDDEHDADHHRRLQHNNNNNNINSARHSCIMQQYYRVRSWMCPCCNGRRQRRRRNIGNMIILFPYDCVTKFNCGIIGPHWFGPVSCLTLLSGATSQLVPRSYRTIGPITAQTCLGFYLLSVLFLGLVSCRDPGVVRSSTIIAMQDDEREGQRMMNPIMNVEEEGAGRGRELSERGSGRVPNRRRGETDGWRYCDLCSVYQPPGAVHCPDCNVCIKGFDHHCPWMGTCIGEKNYTPFLAFNVTWLIYLFYAIVWVLNIGAQLYHRAHRAPSSITPNDDET